MADGTFWSNCYNTLWSLLTHWHRCRHCEAEVEHVKQAAALAAQVREASVEEVDNKLERASFTFMGYDTKSRELLPDGLGEYFPAFTTHHHAIITNPSLT